MEKYTKNKKVKSILGDIPKNKIYSDVIDNNGLQYVDLVQEGGGVLGIALVGYTYILEQAGIRFFSLAGTSAGAINAMLLAGLGKIEDKKSEKILSILANKNLFDFVDGSNAVKRLVNNVLQSKGTLMLLLFNIFKIYKTLKRKHGINPGNNFEEWLKFYLKREKIETIQDLNELRLKHIPHLKHRNDGISLNNISPGLSIIASDITTHSKIEFPKMAKLYWEEPEKLNPSVLVRASMSIPFFFEPLIVKNIPNKGVSSQNNWQELVSYRGSIPSKVKFVDGGLLSNFPINVFHLEDNQIPCKPTFGVRLSTYREDYSKTDSLLGMCGAMISTMRQIYDYDFLLKHPDYKHLICQINADGKFNWLDFNMPEKDKQALFTLGATKAVEFLKKFDWEEYKQIRQNLAR